ncbi:MAG: SWIM zinc finger family protein [Leptolyngbya sp. SIO4C1]|nr:SWIM zinc finger family protein [Leptolyngbya sp. SIO4C1]
MSMDWSTAQVLALSPDAKSTKNGQALATAAKWSSLGRAETHVWGEYRGSGKKPYQTQIDLSVEGGPAFRCSCPSRKFPCKHSLGLMLLLAEQAALFETAAPPDWVQHWVEQRSQQATVKSAEAKKAAKSQTKRSEQREANVQTGLIELDRWLQDLMRQGLASVQAQPYQFWDEIAARLVDAQAPGLARRLRACAGIPYSGDGWVERLLRQLGQIHLLVQSYQRLEKLSPALQAEVRSQIGWTQNQAVLLETGEPKRDRWHILGRRVIEEDRLNVQRTWLWGEQSDCPALVLAFAHGSQPLDTSLVPGVVIDADLVFYPASFPLRALVKQLHSGPKLTERVMGGQSIEAEIARYASALQQNPWLERLPLILEAVVPCQRKGQWQLQETSGAYLPLAIETVWTWELLAVSGGHPVTVSGEWDGETFYPLGAWAEGRWVVF